MIFNSCLIIVNRKISDESVSFHTEHAQHWLLFSFRLTARVKRRTVRTVFALTLPNDSYVKEKEAFGAALAQIAKIRSVSLVDKEHT